MSFDTKQFIAEIEKRPAIWDTSTSLNDSKSERIKAWEEIFHIFHNDFTEKSIKEKNEIAVSLQKRWKSIKDWFHRQKINIDNGEDKSFKSEKEYMHFNNLKFLLPLSRIQLKNNPISIENKQEENLAEDIMLASDDDYRIEKDCKVPAKRLLLSVEDDNDSGAEFVSRSSKRKLKSDYSLYNTSFGNSTNKRREKPSQRDIMSLNLHPDKHFLLSLFEDFRQINEQNKIHAKLEILNVILKYKESSNSTESSSYQECTTQPISNENEIHGNTENDFDTIPIEIAQSDVQVEFYEDSPNAQNSEIIIGDIFVS